MKKAFLFVPVIILFSLIQVFSVHAFNFFGLQNSGYGPVDWGSTLVEVSKCFQLEKIDSKYAVFARYDLKSDNGPTGFLDFAPDGLKEITIYEDIGKFDDCDSRYLYFYNDKLYLVISIITTNTGSNNHETNKKIEYTIGKLKDKYGKPHNEHSAHLGGDDYQSADYMFWRYNKLRINVFYAHNFSNKFFKILYCDPSTMDLLNKTKRLIEEKKDESIKSKTRVW